MLFRSYKSFMASLGDLAKDEKFRSFIDSEAALKSTVKSTAIPVKDLKPTQNEIDIDGSLKFPLTNMETAQKIVKGGAVTIKGPIISFNGKYVIDGHHRWSQIYAANPEASVNALDFSNSEISEPLDALKITQVAIVKAGAKEIPSEPVKGLNLLKAGKDEIVKYVKDNLKDEAILDLYKQKMEVEDIDGVADGIWRSEEHTSELQSH